jgi:acetyl esterase
MPLHPALRHLLEQKRAHGGAPQWRLPIEEVRAAFRGLWSVAMTGAPIALPTVADATLELDGRALAARRYVPEGAARRPVAVFFHGGGYVKGGIEESDAFCRRLAHTTGHAVLAVAYRLAPEHRFPAALEDACAATRWAFARAAALGGRPGSVVVAGESAGGNLAAVTTMLARDRGGPRIARQVLLQPVVDFSLSCPSIAMAAEDCLVPRADLAWYYRTYYDGDPRDPRVSPLWADDLSGLPPALIIAAEHDSLRDEAQAYAERLQAAGVEVRYACYPGMVHGFLQMAGLVEEAQQAIDAIGDFVRGDGAATTAPRPPGPA